MIRTQIYLPDKMAQELKILAGELNISISETIRRAINKALPQIKKRQAKGLDTIIDLIKTDKGPRNLSENIDKYLYGKYRKE